MGAPAPGPLPPSLESPAPTAPVHFVSRHGSAVSESESELEDRLGTIQVRLDTLATNLMDFWKEHALDREHGGVHGKLDRRGRPGAGADKGLVQQARHLWSFSTWFSRRENSPGVKAIADSVYAFLGEHFLDEDGEFFYKVSADGKTVLEPKKQLYAESFAIYGLAAYARVFNVEEAADRAMKCFASIDRRTHDDVHLGYDQSEEDGWLAPGAEKGTNTHIHLLEAFTELYRLTADDAVQARLREMVKVVSSMIVQPAGYAHKEFYADWRAHGPPVVSYGHDLETAWLLLDALDALGQKQDPAIVEVVMRIGKHAAELGFDAEQGGYFEEGIPGGAPTRREKVWWVQAEALAGLWWLYELSGESVHLDRLEKTLSFIETRLVDPDYGGWYWSVLPDGSLGPQGDDKGLEWKTQYHALRATLFTADWIGQRLAATARPREGDAGSSNAAEEGAAVSREPGLDQPAAAAGAVDETAAGAKTGPGAPSSAGSQSPAAPPSLPAGASPAPPKEPLREGTSP